MPKNWGGPKGPPVGTERVKSCNYVILHLSLHNTLHVLGSLDLIRDDTEKFDVEKYIKKIREIYN